jgi:DNA-binding GntR family transcriptional regulator
VANLSNGHSRVSAIVEQLREAIFKGRLPPGSALREQSLGREFGVSQATIREALQRLEHAGLVTRKPNVGTTVTRLSPKDVRERVTLRALLEGVAAQQAAARMGQAEFAELERRLQLMLKAVEGDQYYEAAQADLDFHRYVWECSGNDTLCRLLELVTVPLFAFISILRSHKLHRLAAVVESHEPLLASLKSGDPGRIREAFEQGATRSYRVFFDDSGDRLTAEAFGFLGQ